MNKTAVYTVMTNGYDSLHPIRPEKGFDYFVFTDDKDLLVVGWKPVLIEKGDVKKQREIKLLAHKFLPEYEKTIYIDANMTIRNGFSSLLRQFHGGIMLTKHPNRRCVYAEMDACIKLNKATKEDVESQIKRYSDIDFPKNFGMWSTGMMIRENKKEINNFCELWYKEVEKYTHRDQLAISYALYNSKIKPQTISWHLMRRYVQLKKHKIKVPEQITVFYSSPFRTDKNIGKAYNDFISLLPDNAWICLTDADAMFLQPNYGKQIEDIIRENGSNYGLIGCVTNRLNGLHQLHENEFSENMNIRDHYHISKDLQTRHYSETAETKGIAGLCMIFSKKVWKEAGKFREGTITADTYFCRSVLKSGYKIGIAKGLYLFHCYRIWETSHKKAVSSIKHLK